MSTLIPSLRGAIAVPGWAKNELWRRARALPSLDLRFAENKSLVDARTGSDLVTFTRASTGTYVGADGLIKSAGTNEQRFDHSPTTGESLGLLVEEQRANLLLRSEEFGTTWAGTLSSVTSNTTPAPNGTTTADSLAVNNGETVIDAFISQDVTKAAAAITYTVSVYAKANQYNRLTVTCHEAANLGNRAIGTADLSNGTFTSSPSVVGTFTGASGSIANAGNGWYRISIAFTSGTETSIRTRLSARDSSATTGDGTSGIYIWGAQLEAGAFPTSYIPTTTSAATRSADVADILDINTSSWYNHQQGGIYVVADCMGGNIAPNGNQYNNGIVKFAPATVSVECRAVVFGTNTTPDSYQFAQRNSTANYAASDTTYGDLQAGKFYAFAGSYTDDSTDGIALSVDGRTIRTNTTAAAIPQATRLLIGRGVNGSTSGAPNSDSMYLNGRIKRLTYWPARLPNSTLQSITA